jgi:hypothetical protein
VATAALRLTLLLLVFACLAKRVAAQDVELSWIPPADMIVAGYYVFVAPAATGPIIARRIDAGLPQLDEHGVMHVRVSDLPVASLRIEVTSYDAQRNESPRSNRVFLVRRSEYLDPPIWTDDFEGLDVGMHIPGFIDSAETFSVAEKPVGNLSAGVPGTAGIVVSRSLESQSPAWDAYEVSGRMYLLPGTRRAGVGARIPTSVPWLPDSTELPPNGLDELYSGFTLGGDSTGVFSVKQRAELPLACVNSASTGVSAMAYRWYRFRLRYTEPQHRGRVRAKVWRQEVLEPAAWQVDCWTDALPARQAGVFALYRDGWGGVYWDDLEVRPVRGWWSPPPLP